MTFPTPDQSTHIKPKSLRIYTVALIEKLYEHREMIGDLEPTALMEFYDSLIFALDDAGENDGLGTEGWRHLFGED